MGRKAGDLRPEAVVTNAVWSSSDLPYACLKDMERVLAFQRAIRCVVRPGDIVVDAGAGTGILSFFAAEAGAAKVYAVEIDPLMVSSLRLSVALNGLEKQIAVVPGDAAEVDLPRDVDVVIGELIETGLIDELQAPVMNSLRSRGVIGARTRVIPDRYLTSVELVAVDDTFYGYTIASPFHEWPNYARGERGWRTTDVRPLTRRETLAEVDFCRPVEPAVERTVTFLAIADGIANGVRLSGLAQLMPGLRLGPTNALNGDKILRLPESLPVGSGDCLTCRVSYVMGGGLGTFACRKVG
jgi:SAM-dependent methyltransferase